MGVVTSSSREHFEIAHAHSGLTEYRDFVLSREDYEQTKPHSEPYLTAIQRHNLDHPGKLLLLAEASGTIIGSLSLENGRFRRIAYRGSFGVGVRKEWRGRDIASALLRTLLDWAEANPIIEKICLDVFATHENAIRLYRKLGFVEQGLGSKEVKRSPGQYIDVVWMCRFVKPA